MGRFDCNKACFEDLVFSLKTTDLENDETLPDKAFCERV